MWPTQGHTAFSLVKTKAKGAITVFNSNTPSGTTDSYISVFDTVISKYFPWLSKANSQYSDQYVKNNPIWASLFRSVCQVSSILTSRIFFFFLNSLCRNTFFKIKETMHCFDGTAWSSLSDCYQSMLENWSKQQWQLNVL